MEEAQNQPVQPTTPPVTPPVMRNNLGGGTRKRFAVIAVIVLAAIAIPATIFLSLQQQDLRQRASGGTCQVPPVDVMLVIDTSNSMAGGTVQQAKTAATEFVNKVMPAGSPNRVGLATFDNNGGLVIPPSSNPDGVKAAINGLKIPGSGKGGTCLECALDKKNGVDVLSGFASTSKVGVAKHIIILTDGKINHYQKPDGKIEGSTKPADEKKARDQAAGAVNRILAQFPGTAVSVIQFNGNANQSWITGSVVKSPGTYAQQNDTNTIQKMYDTIANKLIGATITAYVYDDVNMNAGIDATDKSLAGVTVKLKEGSNSQEKITNGTGVVVFSGLCPANAYSVEVPSPTGYEPSPAGTNIRPVTGLKEGGGQKLDFGFKKQTNATSLVCQPTEIAVNGQTQTMTATLKDKDGAPLANKQVTWSDATGKITFSQPGAQANSFDTNQIIAHINESDYEPVESTDTSFLGKLSSALVGKVYAAKCSGNKDCGGGTPYCVGGGQNGSCEECRNPGQSNDCKPGKVCGQNHKCVAIPPTVTTAPTATTVPAAPTVTNTPVPPTATTVPSVSPSPVTGSGATAVTNAQGIATIAFKNTQPLTVSFTSPIKATYKAEGVYTDATCGAEAKYTAPAPKVTLDANPETVASGSSSMLTWTAENVTSCTASEGWSGTKAITGGTESTGPLTEQKTYVLTCTGINGDPVSDTVSVDVSAPNAPTLTLTANPTTVPVGSSTTVTWTSTNTTSCTASSSSAPGWSGTKAVSGSQSVGPLSVAETYILSMTCTGPTGEVTETTTVTATGGPSITSTPGSTSLNLRALLHGIGASGDNVVLTPAPCARGNQAASGSATECFSNQSPVHPVRSVKVEIINQNNETVKTALGTITYDNDLGGFKGAVDLGENWTTGAYTVKVKTPMFLRRQIAGTQNIEANKANELPVFDMISSDVDNDNRLSILDYNMIVSCYTFIGQPPTCNNNGGDDLNTPLNDGQTTILDFTYLSNHARYVDTDDNGVNDEFDENLFRRDLIVQYGQ